MTNEESRLLITTSSHSTLHKQARTLAEIFPNGTYIRRSAHRFSHDYSLIDICRLGSAKNYTALVILNEDRKEPYGVDIIILPAGPRLHFSIKDMG